MKHGAWIVAMATTMMAAPPAWAGRLAVHDAAESTQCGTKAGGMIGRGAVNVATCLVDPIVAVVDETRTGPPVVGTLSGLGKGLGCGLLRLGSGAVDLTMFWVPSFNGVPVSPEYGDCFAASDGAVSTPAAAPAVDQSWSTGASSTPPVEAAPAPATDAKPSFSK